MTLDYYTWHSDIQISFLLTPIVTGVTGVFINRYVASSRHLNVMLAALKNSRWPEQQILKGGLILPTARVNLVAGVSGFLVFPSFSVRTGRLNAEDLRNFPPYLRRWLIASFWLTILGCIGMLLSVCLLKLSAT